MFLNEFKARWMKWYSHLTLLNMSKNLKLGTFRTQGENQLVLFY